MRISELLESLGVPPELAPDIRSTISPTMTIPDLVNSDTYRQYRYTLALASAKAAQAGEVVFDAESTWNESLAAVAYTPAELEIIELANELMGVKGIMISDTASEEPKDTNKTSPVMRFNMFDNLSEGMRRLIDQISDTQEDR